MGKSTISMAIFNSKLLVYQRVPSFSALHQYFMKPLGNFWEPDSATDSTQIAMVNGD